MYALDRLLTQVFEFLLPIAAVVWLVKYGFPRLSPARKFAAGIFGGIVILHWLLQARWDFMQLVMLLILVMLFVYVFIPEQN